MEFVHKKGCLDILTNKVLFNVHYAEVVKPDGGIFNLYYEDIDHVEIVADSHIRLAYHWRGAPAETLL